MAELQQDQFFLGVDVGTGSARAGIFGRDGTLLAHAKRDIAMFRDEGYIAEQSSEDIWQAVCHCVRQALTQGGVSPQAIAGIGFDATCSLVVLDRDHAPLTVSRSGDNTRNIIVWMDHRATDQAQRINATGHDVLSYVGGIISPEMQTPKLLWLKENLPETYHGAGAFLDLPDYLTWRATGDLARSRCTVTCKWTYLGHEDRWDGDYFRQIGLSELADEGFQRIGNRILDVGTALGSGLSDEAAAELGLQAGTPVAVSVIDAHAAGIGTVGARGGHGDATARLGYVFGTSACTMSSTTEGKFVPGVWGPYFAAMIPGLWLNEGGQSAAGEAIAHLVKCHPAYPDARARAEERGQHVLAYLLDEIAALDLDSTALIALARQLVVVPEFLGNRAPFAEPDARAVIAGMDLDDSLNGLIALYVAGISGLGYGLRQILDVQREHGVAPELVVISGGAGAHPLVKQLLADSCGLPLAETACEEPVLLGSAMLGAVAAGACDSVSQAMHDMSRLGRIFAPTQGRCAAHHLHRFKAFEALQTAARLIRHEDIS
ncbi:FGGY-family carbohydrate kinase [Paracoccus seriniphilus]|uniref:FGGY-family pentulose kinase n=1 Tax=Paracoccus seriniphilus TaxID=184748 RepID=A0A239Q250_9RHOB|nr:FGGY-family carbohydrate kinase [Paracoccus seriniphilus]WCR15954.1 FGGY-family carbohydrate kinase [Paracoccus seriniphilus]SNT76679.1 FGGY-family pentulose kinase [Paracoccus seriniphilus]